MMTIPKALAEKLELPVSFNRDGKMITLREFVVSRTKGQSNGLSLSSLSTNQRAKITAERIRREPEVKLATIGAGEIDKQRAIAEVEALSPLGQTLIEAEQYIISNLLNAVENGSLKEIVKEIYE